MPARKFFDPYHVYMKDAAEFIGVTTKTLKKYDGKHFNAARDIAGRRHFTLVELFLIYRRIHNQNPPGDFLVDYMAARGMSSLKIQSWVKQMYSALARERRTELEG